MDRGISQRDFAKICDLSPSALSKIEAGINGPKGYVLWRIAQALCVPCEYLLDENLPYP